MKAHVRAAAWLLALLIPLGALAQGAIFATPTVLPWLAPAETASPTATATPVQGAAVPASSLSENQLDDPADVALTDEQISSLLQNADLTDGEQATDYLELPEGLLTQREDAFTLLVIGTDAYQPDDPARSDTMMLVQVNLRTHAIKLVSFLRDMYVKIPGHGRHRLNSSYLYGGAELLGETLAQNFGVRFDRFLSLNFSLMVELVDQLGGVTVEVSEAERKQLNSILKFYNTQSGLSAKDGLLQESGMQLLSGKQALSFSRIRKIDSDFKRTERQRKVLEAAFDRVCELDLSALTGLLTANLNRVQTDLSPSDAIALLPTLLSARDASFEGMSVPLTNACQDETINGMMVLVPNLKKNSAAIADFLAD